MQRIAVRIGRKDSTAMRTIKDEMTGRQRNDPATRSQVVVAIYKIRRKGEIAGAS